MSFQLVFVYLFYLFIFIYLFIYLFLYFFFSSLLYWLINCFHQALVPTYLLYLNIT